MDVIFGNIFRWHQKFCGLIAQSWGRFASGGTMTELHASNSVLLHASVQPKVCGQVDLALVHPCSYASRRRKTDAKMDDSQPLISV